MEGIIYFIIIVVSSIIGAIAGLGGGLFMRPIFDAVGFHDVINVGFLISTAVVVMTMISTYRKVRSGFKFNYSLVVFMAAGSILGGFMGSWLLGQALIWLGSNDGVQMLQSGITIGVMIVSIYVTKTRPKGRAITHPLAKMVLGLLLGTTGTFLGIGGGPVNIPILMVFFGLNLKIATIYSLLLIFFSHGTRWLVVILTDHAILDLGMLPFVATAALIGGLAGSHFNQVLPEKWVEKVYLGALLFVIVLNVGTLWVF